MFTKEQQQPSPPPFAELFKLDPAKATDEQIQSVVDQQVIADVESTQLHQDRNILVLYDEYSLTRVAADRIYSAVSSADTDRPILLILNSSGGDIAAAYFIAKLCRQHTDRSFEVAIPRRAKSAATLICCGADVVHMGSLSELGPIDPQFGGVPALALKHSVEHLAELVGTYPAASEMFSDYLKKSLRVEALGYYERVAESAVHYATRLLKARSACGTPEDNERIAWRLVYAYKDHGFVIDSTEATDIFGEEVVNCDDPEYDLANTVFTNLGLCAWLCERRFNRTMSVVGAYTNGCSVYRSSGSG